MRSMTLRTEYRANQALAARKPGYQGFTHTRALRQTRFTFFKQFLWWL